MANLALPQRGQPLDVAYIAEIVKAVNELSEAKSQQTSNTTSIDTAASGKIVVKTENAKVVGGYKAIANKTSITSGQEIASNYSFSGFKYVPIVTATPTTGSSTLASKDVSVVITNVTTNRVDFVVKFNSAGTASVGVNLLIVGIPV